MLSQSENIHFPSISEKYHITSSKKIVSHNVLKCKNETYLNFQYTETRCNNRKFYIDKFYPEFLNFCIKHTIILFVANFYHHRILHGVMYSTSKRWLRK